MLEIINAYFPLLLIGAAALAVVIIVLWPSRRRRVAPQPQPSPAPQQPAVRAPAQPQAQATPAPQSTVASPPTQPSPQTEGDDMEKDEEDEPETLPPYTLPVLPKGSPYVYGALASVIIAFLIWYPSFWFLGTLFPAAMAIGMLAFAAWVSTLSLGALLGLSLFVKGLGAPAIQIGYKGVPTFLSGRFSFFGLKPLFDEGETWSTRIIGSTPVDMRIRSLINKPNPDDEEIEIIALALVKPPSTTGGKIALEKTEKYFFAKVTVRVAVRIQVFDPFKWLGAYNAEGILFSAIKERVRLFVRKEQLYQLPGLKTTLTNHLRKNLDAISYGMGIDFVKLFVTEILPPENVLNEAAQIPVDLVRRAAQGYQAETVDRITDLLKPKYPGLSDRDMKDLVLTTMGLATTQAVSISGQQSGLSLVGVNAPKGG